MSLFPYGVEHYPIEFLISHPYSANGTNRDTPSQKYILYYKTHFHLSSILNEDDLEGSPQATSPRLISAR